MSKPTQFEPLEIPDVEYKPMRLQPIGGQPDMPLIEPPPAKSGKSSLEKAALVVTMLTTVLSFIFQWRQNPWLPLIFSAVALLVAASVLGGPAVRYVRSARARTRRNEFIRSQVPEFRQLVRRFAKFTDPKDGKNLWNVIYYGCSANGGDESDFNRLCSPDYLKEVFPLFAEHLDKMPLQDEAEFVDAVKEFYTWATSYNQNYVVEPLKRMNARHWLAETKQKAGVVGIAEGLVPQLYGPWLSTFNHDGIRTNVESGIADFRERWVGYLDVLQPYLENLQHHLGRNIPTYFERPKAKV